MLSVDTDSATTEQPESEEKDENVMTLEIRDILVEIRDIMFSVGVLMLVMVICAGCIMMKIYGLKVSQSAGNPKYSKVLEDPEFGNEIEMHDV